MKLFDRLLDDLADRIADRIEAQSLQSPGGFPHVLSDDAECTHPTDQRQGHMCMACMEAV